MELWLVPLTSELNWHLIKVSVELSDWSWVLEMLKASPPTCLFYKFDYNNIYRSPAHNHPNPTLTLLDHCLKSLHNTVKHMNLPTVV